MRLSKRLGYDLDPIRVGSLAGAGLSHRGWLDLNERRMRLRRACRKLFSEVDVLLTPVAAFVAPHHNITGNKYTRSLRVDGKRRPYTDHLSWLALATTTYLPATSAPVGVTPEGLPINVQGLISDGAQARSLLAAHQGFGESLWGGVDLHRFVEFFVGGPVVQGRPSRPSGRRCGGAVGWS